MTPLTGERLLLEPLRVEHAEEMARVLDDRQLHTFIGGQPATSAELRGRYVKQIVGHSPDRSQRWLNWVAHRNDDGRLVGFVQATVSHQDHQLCADVAWVIGTAYQRRGYAQEAAHAQLATRDRSGHGRRPHPPRQRRFQRRRATARAHPDRRPYRRRNSLAWITTTVCRKPLAVMSDDVSTRGSQLRHRRKRSLKDTRSAGTPTARRCRLLIYIGRCATGGSGLLNGRMTTESQPGRAPNWRIMRKSSETNSASMITGARSTNRPPQRACAGEC
jgi:hypothetical protein